MKKCELTAAEKQLNTGKALLGDGRFAEAEQIFQELINNGEMESEAWNQLGILQIRRGTDVQRAKEYFERSIAVNPQNPAPYSNLGALMHEEGDLATAEEYCQRAIQLDPDFPPALHNLGVIYRKKGNIWTSVKYLKRASKAELRRNRNQKR